jgi:hypothetical protein
VVGTIWPTNRAASTITTSNDRGGYGPEQTAKEIQMLYIESIKHDPEGVFAMLILLPYNTAHERFFTSIEEAEAEVAAFNAFCSK